MQLLVSGPEQLSEISRPVCTCVQTPRRPGAPHGTGAAPSSKHLQKRGQGAEGVILVLFWLVAGSFPMLRLFQLVENTDGLCFFIRCLL